MFRDITTLLKNPAGFRAVIDGLAEHCHDLVIDKIAGIESRGFIIGAPLAYRLNVGFVPIRKQGKLPAENFGHDYELEYGNDRLEIHRDAIEPGETILLIDDLLATGGTAQAAIKLIAKTGGRISGCGFVIELPDLGGRQRLERADHTLFTLCRFAGH